MGSGPSTVQWTLTGGAIIWADALHSCISSRPVPRTDQQLLRNSRLGREQRVREASRRGNGGAPPPPPPPRSPLSGDEVAGCLAAGFGRGGEGGAAHRAAPHRRPAPPLRHQQLRQAAAQQRPRPHAADGVEQLEFLRLQHQRDRHPRDRWLKVNYGQRRG